MDKVENCPKGTLREILSIKDKYSFKKDEYPSRISTNGTETKEIRDNTENE